MSHTLVIVEAPGKVKKIQSILGDDYKVIPTGGHITELMKGGKYGIGIDVYNNFTPRYCVSDNKQETLREMLRQAMLHDNILIASDPDREGEAIAWHIKERLKTSRKPIKRIVFHEISKNGIQKSLNDLREIDEDLVQAQETRVIIDRIVGFTVSPFLMRNFGSNLSAGEVQSVVTRLISDREQEIKSFNPKDYWVINVFFKKDNVVFGGKLDHQIDTEQLSKDLESKLRSTTFKINKISQIKEKKNNYPPLITLSMQRVMGRKYKWSPEHTMEIAQKLYESGLTTYIRTDSTRASEEAIKSAIGWLKSNKYPVPKKQNSFSSKNGQDAHECIRPIDLSIKDSDISNREESLLYKEIWNFFVASQMNPAIYSVMKVEVLTKEGLKINMSGKTLTDPGYFPILGLDDKSKIDFPQLTKGDILDFESLKNDKKKTQPPPRYSDDSILKTLEVKGIGRPSTYAEIIKKICLRNYVEKVEGIYYPTELGIKITNLLTNYFKFMDIMYSSKLEEDLDKIVQRKEDKLNVLNNFFKEFEEKIIKIYLDHGYEKCNKCNRYPVIKRDGVYRMCYSYPNCNYYESLESENKE